MLVLAHGIQLTLLAIQQLKLSLQPKQGMFNNSSSMFVLCLKLFLVRRTAYLKQMLTHILQTTVLRHHPSQELAQML